MFKLLLQHRLICKSCIANCNAVNSDCILKGLMTFSLWFVYKYTLVLGTQWMKNLHIMMVIVCSLFTEQQSVMNAVVKLSIMTQITMICKSKKYCISFMKSPHWTYKLKTLIPNFHCKCYHCILNNSIISVSTYLYCH